MFGSDLATPYIRGKLLLNPAPVSRAVLDIIAQAVTLQRKMGAGKRTLKISFGIESIGNFTKITE